MEQFLGKMQNPSLAPTRSLLGDHGLDDAERRVPLHHLFGQLRDAIRRHLGVLERHHASLFRLSFSHQGGT